MDFYLQRERALDLLESAGIGRGSYAPLLVRLLWRCGIKLKPPHFMGFGSALLLWGGYFSIAWGMFMWLLVWSRQGVGVRLALGAAVGAGLTFGLFLAAYYARQRRLHGLPGWDALAAD